jgi:hypothetical protein
MAKLGINTGIVPNDGFGDSILDGAVKINNNFNEIYNYFGDGTNLTFTNDGSSKWNTTPAGISTLSNVGIGTTNQRFILEVGPIGYANTALWVNGNARITGILTVGTSSIILDGNSNTLTVPNLVVTNSTSGVTASGAGITVRDGGSNLGSAGIIDFGDNLSVSFSAGIATITGAAGGGGGESYWSKTTAGIHTLSNVGIGTTNPTSALTVKGNTSFETLSVSGVSTLSGNVSFGSSAFFGGNKKIVFGEADNLEISHTGGVPGGGYIRNLTGKLAIQSSDEIEFRTPTRFYARFTESFGALLYDNNDQIRLQTLGAGITVTGTTFTNQLSVSGVSTLSSNVSVGGTISIDGGVTLATNNVTIVGTSAIEGEIKRIGGSPFFYDGSAWREFVLSSGIPVSVPADTEWDSVIFRSTFNAGGTNFLDSKFGALPSYVSSGSTIAGSPVKIGNGAFRNDGGSITGIGVSYPYRSEYDFTGSWTIEFWIYHDGTPVDYVSMISSFNPGNTNGEWTFGFNNNGTSILWIWNNEENGTGNRTLYAETVSGFNNNFLNKWNHYALVREGNSGSLHFYINGIESSSTISGNIIDNNIININGAGLYIGAPPGGGPTINNTTWNNGYSIDAVFDDMRISAGFGTAGQRYTSVGIATTATFTPPTTELPTTGTLSSYVQPPGDKYGEIGLGTSPTWRGTSGVTVSQQSSGNYRVSFASTYTNSNDYFVLSQAMDQGFASYVGVARSTTHVDFTINKESDDTAVDTGSLSVQITNHN